MKILVSACLLGENCKYSGGNNYNQAVCDFARGHQVVPGLPGGFGAACPHRGARRKSQGVVTNKEGINVDWGVPSGRSQGPCHCKRKWGGACHPAIPQSQLRREGNLRRNVFWDKDSGQGVFAKMLMDKGIRVLDAGNCLKLS